MQSAAERNGNFLRVFTQHHVAIQSFVRRLVPSRSDADDLLQEVAVVLWEKFDDFQPGTDFKAWAFQIARFKILSRLRDLSRNKIVLANEVVELLMAEASQEEDSLEQQREALQICFKKIGSRHRKLLVSAYQPGVKIHEVAKKSGKSVSGFYQWLNKIRQMLFECIQSALAQAELLR
ncbi:sigma-70 family RNA polymerase sigma factor [Planctomicrobium sp. SH661]|uniref:sigma-70 family RNA polymerase sigma factor n=1 Tax=Planctomicrobium sp. SH661 TaxID=3448124 RepID=UPI003F5C9931